MAFTLPAEFGYVILDVVASIFVLMWMAINVGKARKKYDVKYPQMYSDKEPVFNCVQRAHQNTLENYPQFLILLVLGGLAYPRVNAVAGLVFLLGRVAYAVGYYSGDPSKRLRGGFGYIGFFTMLGTTLCFGLQLLGYM